MILHGKTIKDKENETFNEIYMESGFGGVYGCQPVCPYFLLRF